MLGIIKLHVIMLDNIMKNANQLGVIMIVCHYTTCHYAGSNAKCRVGIVTLSVVILDVTKLSVIILNGVAPIVTWYRCQI